MTHPDQIPPHTGEKLAVYKAYLQGYLGVLTHQTVFTRLMVVDLFAGDGSGSAVIGRNVIAGALAKAKYQHDTSLILNDKDAKNYARLKERVRGPFVHTHNEDADDLLPEILKLIDNKTRCLFFIDPYGYTQISTPNLQKVFTAANAEVLIFVPIFHMYRFRSVPNVADFLRDFGVEEKALESQADLNAFTDAVKTAFRDMSGSEFVYSRALRSRNAPNSSFCLFFVTHNLVGAHKFLEAIESVESALKTMLALFDVQKDKREEMLAAELSDKRANFELYPWGIKNGMLPKHITPILKEWEKKGAIHIDGPDDRRRGAFYIKGNPDKIIRIRMKNDVGD